MALSYNELIKHHDERIMEAIAELNTAYGKKIDFMDDRINELESDLELANDKIEELEEVKS